MLQKWFLFLVIPLSLSFANNETFLCQFGPKGQAGSGNMSDSLYIFITVPANYESMLYIRIFDADCGGEWDEKYGQWNVHTSYQLFAGSYSEIAFANRNGRGALLDSITIGESLDYDNKWQTLFSVNAAQIPVINDKKYLKLRIKSINGNDGNLFLFNVSRSEKENDPIGKWFVYRPVIRINPKKNIVSYLPFQTPQNTKEIIIKNFDADYDVMHLITPVRSDIILKSSGNAVFSITKIKISMEETGQVLSCVAGLGKRAPNNNVGFSVSTKNGKEIPFILPFYQGALHKRPLARFIYHAIDKKNGIAFDASLSNFHKTENGLYYWDFGDGTKGRGLQTTHIFPKPGFYKVKLTISDQSGFVDQNGFYDKEVFVNAPPVAILSAPSVIALGKTVTLNAGDSYDSDGKIIKYIFEIMGEKITTKKPYYKYKFDVPGKYNIKVIVSDNAGYPNSLSSAHKEIIVNSSPVATIKSPPKGAINETIIFDASQSLDSDGEIIGYRWDFGDGQDGSGKIIRHQFEKAGKYTVKLSVTDNSGVENNTAVTSTVIVINSPPIADAGSYRASSAGQKILFSGSKSYDKDGKIVLYEWDFGDGKSATGMNVYHVYNAPGDYNVKLTVTDNSSTSSSTASAITDVHINFPPVAIIKAPSLITINPVEFDASQSYDKDGKIIDYQWDFGDGNRGSGQTVNHTYIKPGTYTVQLKIIDDSNTLTQYANVSHTIIINALPIADAGKNQLVAVGEEFKLDGRQSNDPDGKIASYRWFLDGKEISTESHFTYKLNSSGAYSFLLKVTDDSHDPAAIDYDDVSINVNAAPIADFSVPQRLDPNKTYRFSAKNCYDPDGDALSYAWILNNKIFKGKEFTHHFKDEGLYTLKLIIDDQKGLTNSKQSITKTIWVNGRPIAIAGNDVLTNRFEISLDASSSSDPDDDLLSFKWILGDGSVMNGPKIFHRYKKGGIYPVKLIVSDNKGFSNSENTDNIIVHINRPPVADAGSNIESCAGCTVLFDGSASYDEDKDLLKYHWDFGDGSISEEMSPIHRYERKGLYRVRLKVTDNSGLPGNESQDDILATVFDSPVASFTVDKKTTCVNRPINFDASSSTDIDGVVNAFMWDFGDGKSGNGKKVIHSYETAGIYTVRLKIIGNQQGSYKNYDYYEMKIEVIEGPKATFKMVKKACIGDEVLLDASASKSNSGKIISYEWDFGDGFVATGRSVKHTFKKWGIYPVRLTVKTNSTSSCSKNDLIKSITINDKPSVTIQAADTVALNEFAILSPENIKDKIGGIVSFVWKFSDNTVIEKPFVRKKFLKSGMQQYKLIIKDDMNLPCSKTEYIKNIYVNYPPEVFFSSDSHTYLAGDTVFLDASKTMDKENNVLTYQWFVSDGTMLNGKTAYFVPDNPGEYQVTLVVSDNYNKSEKTKRITIKSLPETDISVLPLGCPLNTFQINISSSNLTQANYLWLLPNGKTLHGKSITYRLSDNNKSETIRLRISGKAIQTTEKEIILESDPIPIADFSVSGTLYAGSLTDYALFDAEKSISKNGKQLSYNWNFGDSEKGKGQKVRHHYKRAGKYKVTLIVNDSDKPCRASRITKTIEIRGRK